MIMRLLSCNRLRPRFRLFDCSLFLYTNRWGCCMRFRSWKGSGLKASRLCWSHRALCLSQWTRDTPEERNCPTTSRYLLPPTCSTGWAQL